MHNTEIIRGRHSCYAFCTGAVRLTVPVKPLQFTDVLACTNFLNRIEVSEHFWRRLAQRFETLQTRHNHQVQSETKCVAHALVSGKLTAYTINDRIMLAEAVKHHASAGVLAFIEPSALLARSVVKTYEFKTAEEVDTQLATMRLTADYVEKLMHTFASPRINTEGTVWLREQLLKRALLIVTLNSGMRDQQCDAAKNIPLTPADIPQPAAWSGSTSAPTQRAAKPQVLAPVVPINAQVQQLKAAAKDGSAFCEQCEAKQPQSLNPSAVQPLNTAAQAVAAQLVIVENTRQAQIKTIQLAALSGAAFFELCKQAAP